MLRRGPEKYIGATVGTVLLNHSDTIACTPLSLHADTSTDPEIFTFKIDLVFIQISTRTLYFSFSGTVAI